MAFKPKTPENLEIVYYTKVAKGLGLARQI